jgi:hypothetical protein
MVPFTHSSIDAQQYAKAPAMIKLALLILVVTTVVAYAEPLPVVKPPGPGGSCPHGYFSSGGHCVPGQNAQDAIPKSVSGNCPWGWLASGSYCLRAGNVRR